MTPDDWYQLRCTIFLASVCLGGLYFVYKTCNEAG